MVVLVTVAGEIVWLDMVGLELGRYRVVSEGTIKENELARQSLQDMVGLAEHPHPAATASDLPEGEVKLVNREMSATLRDVRNRKGCP